jgi:hypothetical protein
MSKDQITVTVADIYGSAWWERNKAELEREWEWSFVLAENGMRVVIVNSANIKGTPYVSSHKFPRIILHGRKARLGLKEVYGIDRITLPEGEHFITWRQPEYGDRWICAASHGVQTIIPDGPRLIVRRVEPKVWFKAEAKDRQVKIGDWYWFDGSWIEATIVHKDMIRLCATRHEEYPPAQVITAAMVEEVAK